MVLLEKVLETVRDSTVSYRTYFRLRVEPSGLLSTGVADQCTLKVVQGLVHNIFCAEEAMWAVFMSTGTPTSRRQPLSSTLPVHIYYEPRRFLNRNEQLAEQELRNAKCW